MKTAIVVTNSDRAGAPVHCLHLIEMLTAAGVTPYFFAGEAREIFQELRALGVHCEVIDGLASAISPMKDVQAILALRKRLSALEIDLVHLHSSKAGLVGRLAAWTLGLPTVYTIHGWGFGPQRPLLQAAFVRLCEWVLKPMTNHWIAVSEADRRQGLKSLGIAQTKITTIYNCVPQRPSVARVEVGGRQSGTLRLAMVARDSCQKDYDTLFRAIAVVPETIRFELKVIGEGTDSLSFRERAARIAGVRAPDIQFLGLRNDIPSILESCDIFCLISHYEGLPIAIIEALRARLPVIATDVGGVRELVDDGENGFLVPVGGEKEVADSICKFAEQPDLIARFADRSFSLYETRFTTEIVKKQVLALYGQVVAES